MHRKQHNTHRRRPRWRLGGLALLPLLLLAVDARGVELRLLVYNTHGLSALIAGDDPQMRFPKIGQATQRYDLALLQEDFAHHERLLTGIGDGRARRGGESRMPWCPICSGSGLTIVSHLPEDWPISIESHAYEACSGWLLGWNDCFATKGFQLARVRTNEGAVVYILNTHLDAGDDPEDRRARMLQLGQITETLQRTLAGSALIVAGDLNLNADNEADRRLLADFQRGLSLKDSGARADAESDWKILDYILYRSGRDAILRPRSVGEDLALVSTAGPLSDHPALFAVFEIDRPQASDENAFGIEG
ncbi:MAG: endonuclease/exonuclease/phosphatase family protein [Deltaproteobacteria bacterium]